MNYTPLGWKVLLFLLLFLSHQDFVFAYNRRILISSKFYIFILKLHKMTCHPTINIGYETPAHNLEMRLNTYEPQFQNPSFNTVVIPSQKGIDLNNFIAISDKDGKDREKRKAKKFKKGLPYNERTKSKQLVSNITENVYNKKDHFLGVDRSESKFSNVDYNYEDPYLDLLIDKLYEKNPLIADNISELYGRKRLTKQKKKKSTEINQNRKTVTVDSEDFQFENMFTKQDYDEDSNQDEKIYEKLNNTNLDINDSSIIILTSSTTTKTTPEAFYDYGDYSEKDGIEKNMHDIFDYEINLDNKDSSTEHALDEKRSHVWKRRELKKLNERAKHLHKMKDG